METVTSAREWANTMVRRESRGPGDVENAMHRLEARYGIPWRTFWALRYRPPKDILAGIYLRLQAAHEQERQRQIRLLRDEYEETRKTTGDHPNSVRAAKAVVDEMEK